MQDRCSVLAAPFLCFRPLVSPFIRASTLTSPALEQAERLEDAMVHFREATEHLKAYHFDQAEERAKAALEAYPRMAAAQRLLGLIHLQQGRLDRSVALLEESLRTEPFHPEALSNLAFAYFQLDNRGVALELIETCRRLNPDYKPALLQQGLILLAGPITPETIEILQQAVTTFPNMPSTRNNLAVAYARQGDYTAAREQLQTILTFAPNDFPALFNMGGLAAKETNAVEAVTWLRQAMDHTTPTEFQRYLSDPDLDPIRDTPEYQTFLEEL